MTTVTTERLQEIVQNCCDDIASTKHICGISAEVVEHMVDCAFFAISDATGFDLSDTVTRRLAKDAIMFNKDRKQSCDISEVMEDVLAMHRDIILMDEILAQK